MSLHSRRTTKKIVRVPIKRVTKKEPAEDFEEQYQQQNKASTWQDPFYEMEQQHKRTVIAMQEAIVKSRSDEQNSPEDIWLQLFGEKKKQPCEDNTGTSEIQEQVTTSNGDEKIQQTLDTNMEEEREIINDSDEEKTQQMLETNMEEQLEQNQQPLAQIPSVTNSGESTINAVPESDPAVEALTSFASEVPVYAIDVECVRGNGVSLPARVSLVDQFGRPVYDTYIRVDKPILNYQTRWSGIQPKDLTNAPPFCQVIKELHRYIEGSVLVGHAINNDLRYLGLRVDNCYDTQIMPEYTRLFKEPSLKKLVKHYFKIDIQQGAHNSITDAYYTMALFKRLMTDAEFAIVNKFNITDIWPCSCAVHNTILPNYKKKHKINLFYRLHNVLNGKMDHDTQLMAFDQQKKLNSPAWRRFVLHEKKKFKHGKITNNDEKKKYGFLAKIFNI